MSHRVMSGSDLVSEADKHGIAVFVADDGGVATWGDADAPAALLAELSERGCDIAAARKAAQTT